jgi:putative IMPACT (imprinted ancient) family translation regulator
MYAYRSTDKSQGMEKLACGQNDGGESGSGGRLSKLLESSNCENVIVVVSRWYGGTKLGSDRWKRISEVAKEALGKGGFTHQKKPSTRETRHK